MPNNLADTISEIIWEDIPYQQTCPKCECKIELGSETSKEWKDMIGRILGAVREELTKIIHKEV